MATPVKNYETADIKVFCSCQIFFVFFNFCPTFFLQDYRSSINPKISAWKLKFIINYFFSKGDQICIGYTYWKIRNRKLHFLCSISAGNCEHIWSVYETLSNIYNGAFSVNDWQKKQKKPCQRCLIKSIRPMLILL